MHALGKRSLACGSDPQDGSLDRAVVELDAASRRIASRPWTVHIARSHRECTSKSGTRPNAKLATCARRFFPSISLSGPFARLQVLG
jgi:hypothetical protein